MKKLLLILTLLGSVSCIEEESVSSIRVKSWDTGFSVDTKARTKTIDVAWEQGDRVTIFSVRDGVVTYRSDVEVTAKKWNSDGESEKATITAEIDVNADSYYAYFPATVCPLKVGDKYSLTYDKDETWTDVPRFHDLPQYAEVSSTAKSINFEPLTACFRLSNVRESKLPVPVSIWKQEKYMLDGKSHDYWKPIYEGVISASTVDLESHHIRKSLFGWSDYYDFCWILPEDNTYKVECKAFSDRVGSFTLKRGQVAEYNLYLK